ncbi:hypothetical protein EYR36_008873 [Pleurotus pulmonarius]|nr:hypothetical protein EYR36_008873 [Pleurotus pulmonarius]
MPADYQEEVIADSEEEDIYAPLDTTHETIDHYESTRVIGPSSVDTYGVLATEPSNISNFTDLPSTLFARSNISSVASIVGDSTAATSSTSRPKPRPIKRKNDSDISNSASSSSTLPLVVDDGAKKKDRPRPRPIKRKQPDADANIGGTPSAVTQQAKDNSESYGMDIAERAKVRRRTVREKTTSAPEPSFSIVSPPPKRKQGSTGLETLEVIELSSEDELSMKAPARPKKGPKAKATPGGRAVTNTSIPTDQTAAVSSSQPTIPVPSSSLSGYNHASLPLPPSDIPESPLTEPEHPPIAAMSEPESLDIGPRLDQGHEPSLFTPEPVARKRKRGVIYDDDDDDELAMVIKPPIPTFFASSSPPPLNPPKQSKTPSKKQKTIVPLDPIPPATKKKSKSRSKKQEDTVVPDTGSGHSTAPKRKGKGKKKNDEEVANVPDEEQDPALNMAPLSGPTVTFNADDDGTEQPSEAAQVSDPPLEPPLTKRKGSRRRKEETGGPELAPSVEPDVFEEDPPSKVSRLNHVHRLDAHRLDQENHPPVTPAKPIVDASSSGTKSSRSSLTSRYSIAPRTKSTPMSELIRRVNSMPGSPFAASPAARTGSAYSPYLKTSKSTLSRIAPLHPNRRAPPPPPPPPPPKKKTKKEIEREEKWEEELIESLGGLDAWVALSDADRKDLRRGKFEMEMNGWD